MQYSQAEDDKVTANLIELFTKLVADEYGYSLIKEDFDSGELSAERMITPSSFSTRSKLEYYTAKLELMRFLKFGKHAWITNPEWALQNSSKIYERFDWWDTLEAMVGSLNQLYETLNKRAVLKQKRKLAQQIVNRKQPSDRKRIAAIANGLASGNIRRRETNDLRERIIYEAWKLLSKGTSGHNIASKLAKIFPISERQIRRYLKEDYFDSEFFSNYRVIKDGDVLRAVKKYKYFNMMK